MKSAEKKAGSNAVLKPLRMGFALCLGLLALSAATDGLAQAIPGKEIHVADARDLPFCEIGLITGTSAADAIANIYNSTGTSDCPPAKFDAIMSNPEALAKQTGSLKVWLNPRRHWVFDEFWVYEVGNPRDFDGVTMSWMGKVNAEAMEKATVTGDYTAGRIFRNNKFLFKKGSTVYLLDAPDGKTVFVMQSYTDHWNKGQTMAGLPQLGSKLTLPPGWKFRVKTLDSDLTVSPPPPDRMALVMQDNLHNTYQGCGTDAACDHTP